MYLTRAGVPRGGARRLAPLRGAGRADRRAARAPVEGAHGWSGRDLIGHLVAWQEHALAVARELAVGETARRRTRPTPTGTRAATRSTTRSRPVARPAAGRGPAAVPHGRPASSAATSRSCPRRAGSRTRTTAFFLGETIEHYEEHEADLAAILASAGVTTDGRRGRPTDRLGPTDARPAAAATNRPETAAGPPPHSGRRRRTSSGPAVRRARGRSGRVVPASSAVAAAALRTPDTVPSAAGRGWVAFRPAELDQQAIDRMRGLVRERRRRRAGGPARRRPRRGPRHLGRHGPAGQIGRPPVGDRGLRCVSRRDGLDAARAGRGSTTVGLANSAEAELLLELLERPEARPRPAAAAGLEERDRRDAHDVERLREAGVGVDVDLDHVDLSVVLGGELLHLGRDHLAGPAPGGPEVDDDRLARS